MANGRWIGVDLDGTLAKYTGWGDGSIGDPIPAMVESVQEWITEGTTVKIVTARVSALFRISTGKPFIPTAREQERIDEAWQQVALITEWCKKHIGHELEITAMKDYGMMCLYDDRCRQVEANTGRIIEDSGGVVVKGG